MKNEKGHAGMASRMKNPGVKPTPGLQGFTPRVKITRFASDRGGFCLGFILEHGPDLLAEFRAVRVSMHGGCVMDRSVEHLRLGA